SLSYLARKSDRETKKAQSVSYFAPNHLISTLSAARCYFFKVNILVKSLSLLQYIYLGASLETLHDLHLEKLSNLRVLYVRTILSSYWSAQMYLHHPLYTTPADRFSPLVPKRRLPSIRNLLLIL